MTPGNAQRTAKTISNAFITEKRFAALLKQTCNDYYCIWNLLHALVIVRCELIRTDIRPCSLRA